jgi:hypothetical protein
MKKLLLFLLLPTAFNAQVVGTWKLANQAAAMGVGPSQGSMQWWSNTVGDLTTRACMFDDSITFNANGTMMHYMNGQTWLEAWQGMTPDACGTPVAPHNGSNPATYAYDGTTNTLSVYGLGAHMGLAKVINGSEIASPANAADTITYLTGLSNGGNTLTLDINVGANWWQFVYQKTVVINPPTPNITFKVDMSQYTGPAYTGVFVNGTFNGWNGTSNPMSDANLDGVWEATVPIGAGAIEYKFTLNGWAFEEQFVGGESCTVTNGQYTNRSYTVTGDATLGTVCYNSCAACANNVTFKVDMANYVGLPFTGVFINGTFNNWCGVCNPMTDTNMDGIWDLTIPLPNGSIEYKFTLDGFTGEEVFLGGEPCTVTTGQYTNRSYTVAGIADLGVVCYNSCAACPAGIEDLSSEVVSVYPNPSNGTLAVVSNSSAILNNITNIMGETVIVLKGNESNINIESLRAGIYFLNFTVKGENQTIRITKN